MRAVGTRQPLSYNHGVTSNVDSPYLLDEPPTSAGRVLLARAFSHWCMLHHGYSPAEIAAALDASTMCNEDDRRTVGSDARLIGELLAAGQIRAFARPIGGGEPSPLAMATWERDDFRAIFARSALDPTHPFKGDVEPTHWIFFDIEDFNGVLEASCATAVPPQHRAADGVPAAPAEREVQTGRHLGNDLVRIDEVKRRTGMSKATIYRRILEGRFPKQIPMKGNIAAWRESDIADWLADPR